MAMKKDWIAGAVGGHPGALHKALGVAPGKTIPQAKIMKAEHSKNSKLAAEARLAENLHKLHHGTG